MNPQIFSLEYTNRKELPPLNKMHSESGVRLLNYSSKLWNSDWFEQLASIICKYANAFTHLQ